MERSVEEIATISEAELNDMEKQLVELQLAIDEKNGKYDLSPVHEAVSLARTALRDRNESLLFAALDTAEVVLQHIVESSAPSTNVAPMHA